MASQLSATQGDTVVFRINVENADGTALDVTSFDLTFTIKRSRQDSDSAAVFQGTLADAINYVTGNSAAVDVEIPALATANMRSGRLYYWDLELTDTVQTFTPCSGTFFVNSQVTNG